MIGPPRLAPNWFRRKGRKLGAVKHGPGIEDVVAHILERAAVKFVGAALRYQVDLPARAAARFGRIERGTHFEFRDGIHADDQAGGCAIGRVLDGRVVHAVEGPVIVVVGAAGEARRTLAARAGVHRAGRQHHEARPVTAVDRQRVDLVLLDDEPISAEERSS